MRAARRRPRGAQPKTPWAITNNPKRLPNQSARIIVSRTATRKSLSRSESSPIGMLVICFPRLGAPDPDREHWSNDFLNYIKAGDLTTLPGILTDSDNLWSTGRLAPCGG
jgi:hypothetical protein